MSSSSLPWIFIIAVCFVHTTLDAISVNWDGKKLVIAGLPPYGAKPEGNKIELSENDHIWLGQGQNTGSQKTYTGAYREFTVGPAAEDVINEEPRRAPINHLELATILNEALQYNERDENDVPIPRFNYFWPMKFGGASWTEADYQVDKDTNGHITFSERTNLHEGEEPHGGYIPVEDVGMGGEGQEPGDQNYRVRHDRQRQNELRPYAHRVPPAGGQLAIASEHEEAPPAGGGGGKATKATKSIATFDPRVEVPHKQLAHVEYFNLDDLENLDKDYRDPMYQNGAAYGDDAVDYGWFHTLSWIGFNLLLWMIIGGSCFCGGVACTVFVYSFYYWVRKVQKRNSLSLNDIEQMA